MAGKLTTHVLDTSSGLPAAGLRVDLVRMGAHGPAEAVASARTNADGRCDAPLLEGAAMVPGIYQLVFCAGDYFRDLGIALPDPAFLDAVPVRFGIADVDRHYHVPLLLSPYGYSTYRGS